MIAKHAYYSGRVQGVGFRHKTWTLAQGYRVAGFVRNLANGDVELWAEGETDEVDRFLSAIDRHMAAYIQTKRVSDETPQNIADFSVRG